jgi:arylsulfatase A-like enzyme
MPQKTLTPVELSDAWHDVNLFRQSVIPSRGTFDPGSETRLRWAQRYCESLTFTDLEIGRLLEEARARTDWDRTIVTVTGDHGEELYERGTWHHSWNQLHREGIRVPLIIRVPGENHLGSIDYPVSQLDVAPTLLDFAGIEAPRSMLGSSLRPAMEGQQPATRPVFTEMMGHADSAIYRLAIRDGEWKYIFDAESPRSSKLFRVTDDPDERINLLDRHPSVLKHFEQLRLTHMALCLIRPAEQRMTAATEAAGRPGETKQRPIPDETGDEIMREQLEALGYL